jgi:hypothetical protein
VTDYEQNISSYFGDGEHLCQHACCTAASSCGLLSIHWSLIFFTSLLLLHSYDAVALETEFCCRSMFFLALPFQFLVGICD